MGCWNKTCGLSGLPIFAGDPVYVFVLQENLSKDDRCYSTAFWKPLLVPFNSFYNDYGAGENSSGVALDTIMAHIGSNLIEMEQGPNQYHDIPVKKEGFNEDKFFDVVHESRLRIGLGWDKSAQLDYVMFRKDVVDYILENNVHQNYVGGGKGNCGWNNNYIKIKFSDILVDMDGFIDRSMKKIETERFLISDMLIDYGVSLVDDYLRVDTYRMSSVMHVGKCFIKYLQAGNIEGAKEFLNDWLIGSYLNCFMEATRKNWMPGGYEGSQSGVNSEYKVLISAMQHTMQKIKEEYDEEYGEDGE